MGEMGGRVKLKKKDEKVRCGKSGVRHMGEMGAVSENKYLGVPLLLPIIPSQLGGAVDDIDTLRGHLLARPLLHPRVDAAERLGPLERRRRRRREERRWHVERAVVVLELAVGTARGAARE